MENKIEIFKNEELGELRTVLNSDGSISVNAEDTARGFGWVQTQNKNEKQYTSIRWETIDNYCEEFGFPNKLGKDDFIPESLFYLLGMKANNETARKFQMWLAKDVIPSIRKHGLYITEELLKDKEKLQCEIDKIQNEYYELEHKNIYLETDIKTLQAEKEEIEEENVEFRKQRQTIFRLSVKTGQDESYIPDLALQVIREYVLDNEEVVIETNESGYKVKKRPLMKELNKLILRKQDIVYVLGLLRVNIEDDYIFIRQEFMDKDYEPIGSLYL